MASSGWIVTGQVSDQTTMTTAGQPVIGTYVYFLTSDGNEGSVFVPDQHYTTAKARAMVEARAAVVDSVGKQSHNYVAPA